MDEVDALGIRTYSNTRRKLHVFNKLCCQEGKLVNSFGRHMKFYIATSFKSTEDFHKLRKLLEVNGHTLVHDWTLDTLEGVPPDELETIKMVYATNCLLAVMEADVFILLARPNMAGAFVELGFALANNKAVVALEAFKEGNQSCIFYHLCQSGAFQHLNEDELLLVMGSPKSSNLYDRVTKIGDDPIQLPGNN